MTIPGYNQTEFEFLNPEDRELVGEEILNLLGLGRVPETKNKKLKQKDKDKEFHLRAQENHPVSFERNYIVVVDPFLSFHIKREMGHRGLPMM